MRITLAIRILAGALACCAALFAQLVPEQARKAADLWLAKDCSEGERNNLEGILAKYKTQLEPVFVRAVQQGPGDKQLAAEDAAAAKQFELRQKALQSGKGTGLSPADLKAAGAESGKSYLARQRADFILRYRSRAVAALGIVDGVQGKAALRALAQDNTSPLQAGAQAALIRLGEPPAGPAPKK
jgi:hypothetical protein